METTGKNSGKKEVRHYNSANGKLAAVVAVF
jgi:hypothetical protein